MSCHSMQLWHIFMGALLTNFQLLPPHLYQEYPSFPLQLALPQLLHRKSVYEKKFIHIHTFPKEISNQRRIPTQYWTALLGLRQDELRDQHPLAAFFTKERVKTASQSGFLLSGSKPLCWLTQLIKKQTGLSRIDANHRLSCFSWTRIKWLQMTELNL